ncbi:MAG: hypothetical protein Q4B26_04965 [Eubacteriales bacterium]|nr:hypothetical protein [Eubacteriales bacterium]
MGVNFVVFIILVIWGIAFIRDMLVPGRSFEESAEDVMGELPPDLREGFKAEWFKPFQRQGDI